MTSIYDITDEHGVILNRIFADAVFVEAHYPGCHALAGEASEPSPAFPTLSRVQLRLGLFNAGITADDVEVRIATIEDEAERTTAMIEWQARLGFERHHPLLVRVTAELGLMPDEVDALWVQAARL